MANDDYTITISGGENTNVYADATGSFTTTTLGIADDMLTINTDDMLTINTGGIGIDASIEIVSVEFEDTFPDIYKVRDMLKHYPALEKAFENFKTVYKMVDQDYKGNHQDNEEFQY